MITVRNRQALDALQPEDKMSTLAREIRESTAKHEQTAQENLTAIKSVVTQIAAQRPAPAQVVVQEAPKIRRWKFTFVYDDDDRIISTIAEAEE